MCISFVYPSSIRFYPLVLCLVVSCFFSCLQYLHFFHNIFLGGLFVFPFCLSGFTHLFCSSSVFFSFLFFFLSRLSIKRIFFSCFVTGRHSHCLVRLPFLPLPPFLSPLILLSFPSFLHLPLGIVFSLASFFFSSSSLPSLFILPFLNLHTLSFLSSSPLISFLTSFLLSIHCLHLHLNSFLSSFIFLVFLFSYQFSFLASLFSYHHYLLFSIISF